MVISSADIFAIICLGYDCSFSISTLPAAKSDYFWNYSNNQFADIYILVSASDLPTWSKLRRHISTRSHSFTADIFIIANSLPKRVARPHDVDSRFQSVVQGTEQSSQFIITRRSEVWAGASYNHRKHCWYFPFYMAPRPQEIQLAIYGIDLSYKTTDRWKNLGAGAFAINAPVAR